MATLPKWGALSAFQSLPPNQGSLVVSLVNGLQREGKRPGMPGRPGNSTALAKGAIAAAYSLFCCDGAEPNNAATSGSRITGPRLTRMA